MELVVITKGSKYIVQDKKSRLLYTVKKKGFGERYVLLDASNYNLYTLHRTGDDRKPSFSIILNDAEFMKVSCKSLFLDPTLLVEGREMSFTLASKDRRNFEITHNGITVGQIKTKQSVSGELQYEIEIENTLFDDYISLFAVAIDKTFGDMNKQ